MSHQEEPEHTAQGAEVKPDMSIFRPAAYKAATAVLDRELFTRTFPLSAARIANKQHISKFRNQLFKSKEVLELSSVSAVCNDPDSALAAAGSKCILLRPGIEQDDPKTWSLMLQEAVKQEELRVIPYQLTLDYKDWTYHQVMEAMVPDRLRGDSDHDIPTGYTSVGHVAHLNLREFWLPYKHLIGQVLIDKIPTIKTVINKTEDVGTDSVFRTFPYEVLAGPDNMEVEAIEEDCLFRFDYSKVYWNSRLNTEHRRITTKFQPGEVVVDVMAGVGPFAVPAGKRGVFVWANDLNPDSYTSMQDAITRNKVSQFVKAFCEDGRTFIAHAVNEVLELTKNKQNVIQVVKSSRKRGQPAPEPETITIPQTVSHFVMNLPATAIDFLSSYAGVYAGHEDLFAPNTAIKLPMVHVHCFSVKPERGDDYTFQHADICARISKELGVEIKPGHPELEIFDVRDVAPKKQMFCASFRLPPEVAFRRQQE